MKSLTLSFILFYCVSFGQSDKAKTTSKTTPFDPKGNYQTFAVRLRLLPWTIGDDKGFNVLGGLQLGFFKNHSISADIMKGYINNNLDAYYRNDSLIKPTRNRNESRVEFHFAYNYHFNFESLRKKTGLNFYAGITYRIGQRQLVSDTAMYANDKTIRSNRRYYSFGPQLGLLWNIGQSKIFALNFNITPLYTITNATTTKMEGSDLFTNRNTVRTFNFRAGLNLILWLKYFKR